jgi:alkylated DNA repair dioxygenase AlkB
MAFGMARQGSLLGREPEIEGLKFDPQFITAADEAALLDVIRPLDFRQMKMRGVVARRRVLHYGVNYSFETFRATPGPPIPAFLLPLREKAGGFAGVDPAALAEALITEYSPGATIGWHKDAAPFDIVIGISLASECRFRFRRGKVRAWETAEMLMPPRSAYVLDGAARREWEHSIPALKQLRYSVTFRTLR